MTVNPESQDPLIGMTLGGCRIQALLGRGGMGTVYRAHHIALDKTVALKLLAAHLEADHEFVERFVREARAAAKVEHPNVIQVLNVAEEKSQHFIILQYIDGENLEQLMDRSGRLNLQTATRIVREAASGLEALHAQEIIHRDIKPANIMLSKDGGVKITDFGLARNLKAASSFTTVSGAFMGTPGFVAPEQVDGPAVDARADLYALGVVYYMMLSGELPFNAINALEMATQRLTLDPIPLESRVPGVDRRAVEIVHKLLQRKPEDRFVDAGELVAALDQIVAPPPAATAPPPPPAPRASPPPPPDTRRSAVPVTPDLVVPPKDRRGVPEEVPMVEIFGRRNPGPAAAVEPEPSEVVPEIAAGPKKRVIQGEPIVPREIEAAVPLPARAPKTRPLRAEDYPSNPDLKKETTKRQEPKPVEPPKPPPKWKHVPPPRKELRIVSNLAFWLLVLGSCAALFSVGALGASLWEENLLVSFPRPFFHQDGGLVLRLGVAGAAIALMAAAFVINRKQFRSTSHPGPAVMIPIFASFCFYAAGLVSTGEGQGVDLVRSAALHTVQSLAGPSNLAFLAVWSLVAGLLFGMSGRGEFDHSAGSIFVVGALVAMIGFAAGGDIPGVVSRYKGSPMLLAYPTGGLLVAFLGLFLAFGFRAGAARQLGGIVVILGALGLGYYGGLPVQDRAVLMDPFKRWMASFGQHGAALILGAMLLSWGAWVLHRMVSSPFGKSR